MRILDWPAALSTQSSALRLGDYVLLLAMALNVTAACAYGYQGHWKQVGYWLCAFGLNFFLLQMR